ncbi:MAG: signal peptidase II [Planctomycetota bacterium]|nr:MAG: signal peptidase II [Planctomycetota bacterium]
MGSPWIRYSAILVILATCVGCDQVTKHIARQQLDGRPPRSYFSDVVRLVYAENPGAFLGLGGGLPPGARWALLVVVNAVVAGGIAAVLLWHSKMPWLRAAACALLLSGAVGNLIDRVRFDGLVIDFMNLGIGPLRTGIFNVADVAITTGAVLLILPQLAPGRSQPEPAEAG